jgi:hypothetical protein
MRARITCNENHELGKKFVDLFDEVKFFSRSTGFNANDDLNSFLEDTSNYDWTINLTSAPMFGQVKVLALLDTYCDKHNVKHKVFNIGSYVGTGLLAEPETSYDIEKSSLKYAHKKIAYEHMFHDNNLDSYLLNLGFLEKLSRGIHEKYQHVNTLSLDVVIENVKFMMARPYIKEMYLQYNQPGNYRINNGIGILLPGVY